MSGPAMTRALIVLTEGFADWECALLMAAGRAHLGLAVETASPDGGRVASQGGLAVTPDIALAAADPTRHDAIVLCGGEAWTAPSAPDMAGTLRAFAGAGRVVAGICAGTRPLAAAGLLDSRAHTSNAADFLAGVPGYGGAAHYRDGPRAVADGGVVTAPGTAPVSFAVAVLEALDLGSPDLTHYAGLFGAEHRTG
jgi:putative intracellular protease/amidase